MSSLLAEPVFLRYVFFASIGFNECKVEVPRVDAHDDILIVSVNPAKSSGPSQSELDLLREVLTLHDCQAPHIFIADEPIFANPNSVLRGISWHRVESMQREVHTFRQSSLLVRANNVDLLRPLDRIANGSMEDNDAVVLDFLGTLQERRYLPTINNALPEGDEQIIYYALALKSWLHERYQCAHYMFPACARYEDLVIVGVHGRHKRNEFTDMYSFGARTADLKLASFAMLHMLTKFYVTTSGGFLSHAIVGDWNIFPGVLLSISCLHAFVVLLELCVTLRLQSVFLCKPTYGREMILRLSQRVAERNERVRPCIRWL